MKLVDVKRPTCVGCNRLTEVGATCPSCRNRWTLAGVSVPGHYEGALKQLIWELKFNGNRGAAASLARLMLASPLPRLQWTAVVAVPSSGKHQRRRGFNQAKVLARAVSRELGLPLMAPLLQTRDFEQIGQGRQERFSQARYGVRAKTGVDLVGAKVLFIDDVVTTGATMDAYAKALREAGAKKVWGLAAAKY